MFKDHNVRVSEKYVFLFDKTFDNNMQDELMKKISQRWNKLSSIIGLKENEWKKIYYLFENIVDTRIVSGQTYNKMIKCKIYENYLDDMPMIHEEAHMITYQRWGKLPYSWSEGFAEYIVAMYYNEIALLTGEDGDILNIEYGKHINEILYTLTSDDPDFFSFVRTNHIFYAMSLASILYYIIVERGIEQIEYIIQLLKASSYELLREYLEKCVLYEWIRWLSEKKN